MSKLPETASQTAGPYVHIGCLPEFAGLAGYADYGLGQVPVADLAGDQITLTGRVLDGAGDPVGDAMVEMWQASADGAYAEGQAGFGRTGVDRATGAFHFQTVKPGSVALHDGRLQAPHVALWIAARGINIGLHTRAYFDDDDHSDDPVLSLIDPARRATLIARKSGATYALDIHLQGPHETVFFDV